MQWIFFKQILGYTSSLCNRYNSASMLKQFSIEKSVAVAYNQKIYGVVSGQRILRGSDA